MLQQYIIRQRGAKSMHQLSNSAPEVITVDAGTYLVRTMTADDASERWATWFSDPHVMFTLNSPNTKWSKDTVIKYIDQFDQRSNLLLGIFAKQPETLVGIFTIKINHATRQGLITVLIGESEYRNKGAFSAVRVPLYDYLFVALRLKMLLASVLARNNIVIDSMLKKGWKLDQALKNNIKSNSVDAMLDLCLFSLTRDSWRAWRKANRA
jgi:RimJ/RimL family protein N-acetyltransferase